MSTDDWTRDLARHLFGKTTDDQPPTEPPAPEPITGPVIPRQEATPAPQPQWTEQHRWANRLLSADTAHEIY